MRTIVRTIFTWIFVAAIGGMAIAVVGEFFIKVAEDKGYYKDAGYIWDRAMRWAYELVTSSFVIYPMTLLTGLVAGLWLDWLLKYIDGRTKMPTPPLPEDGFRESVRPLQSVQWVNLLDLADELRRDLANSPLGESIAKGRSRHDELSLYAGLLNDVAALHGVRPPSLRSEAITIKGERIVFRVNGAQMDSTDQSGAQLYRFVHIRADEASDAKVRATALLAGRMDGTATAK